LKRFAHWLLAPLEWIGKYEAPVLALLLVLTAAISVFIYVADLVNEGRTDHFDTWAVRALRRPDDPETPVGPAWLMEVGRDMTALGGIAFLTLLIATIAGFLWLRRMYAAMLLLLASTTGGLVLSLVLKQWFHRERPSIVPHLTHVYTNSFPSGHAMLSATVFLTLGALLGRFVPGLALRAYFLLVAGMLTLLVGVSRVYMGVHYPTDVLAGWSAGLAWALACWLAARALQRRGIVEPSSDFEKT
jgi:undecaprenyl-diphosphatase